ncbi:PaaX family transcriptional regulator [Planosporangium mesophilum]|jgi:phenylacetic acid degradation operon negative regulatory protein|uniref:Phenylacetic acid degradation operon negative regulatory protein n=1 Tax=Planosporangium mesophilum TaxID=689768 RepID=A0A8J3T6U0_9ACTN|nr:PaaX family transcriptional regulator C-terminal domain-containing protein [Planosporangium mesophilum]NJC81044.1 PaaX family transcriptional regulator [Planosporangium mesophilum]GII21313.1 phenylacetic acid degradation operon negative regulatory protein [Planosporangium mesophilum]
MQARSALFDLYGDHLQPRGGRAPVAALVRLLAPLGIAAPAVRTAVSRMVRQGWLHPLRLSTGPGYLLTPKAARRLDEAAARIYRTGANSWDGRFDLVVIDPPAQRADRGRLAANLTFLGYGAIDAATWVAARPTDEVETLLGESGIRYERFSASHSGGVDGAVALVRRAWDLAEIGAAYEEFVRELTPTVTAIDADSDDEQAYAARFTLVHAWRTFLFRDPQLPPELLPEPWPGSAAAAFFDSHAARLRPAADRFVDRCLDLATSRPPVTGTPVNRALPLPR